MALGVGVASIRSDEKAKSDSFGLIALCSIGPILAVLILSFIYNNGAEAELSTLVKSYSDTVHLGHEYLRELPDYLGEVAVALERDGVTTNCINTVMPDSTWLQLAPGVNSFSYTVDEGDIHLGIYHTNKYQGV